MRTRRKFTDKFKRAAVRRLATVSVAEVAEISGVSVSVLHRWRKQLGNPGVVAKSGVVAQSGVVAPNSRRQFSKEFKEAAVRRLEQGETVREVVCGCPLNPTVLRRWWHEWRRYGETAFSGYGKPRAPSQSSQTVIVRFTQDEYESIQAATLASRASSLPDFVRGQVLSPAPSVAEIARRLAMLVSSMQRTANDLRAKPGTATTFRP